MDIQSLKDINSVKKYAKDTWKDFLEETKKLKNVDGNVLKKAFNFYFVEYLKEQYTSFSGRIPRFYFWIFMLFAFLIGGIINIIPFLAPVYWLAIAVPCVGICCKRLHDIDLPSYWVISVLFFIGIFLLILPGDKKENKYGPVIK